MKILIITQDDKFYLPGAIEFFLELIRGRHLVVGAVVTDVSPFGQRASFIAKAWRTLYTFGVRFFLQYSYRYIRHFVMREKSVSDLLREAGIPILKIKESLNSASSLKLISECQPDVIVSVAGNEIFRRPLIDLTEHGILNLHTALLPKYRGLMPTFWVIKNREVSTGVSVFLVDEGIDSGPIVSQKAVEINGMSQAQLIGITKRLGMEAMCEALDILSAGIVNFRDNDNSQKTYYSFPTKQDVSEFRKAGGRFY